MKNVQKHLSLLGKKVTDKISGATGVVDSVCFDLYGCIQGSINIGVDKDGNRRDSLWMDVSRMQVVDEAPVMSPPDWEFGDVAEGKHGPADKSGFSRY